MGRRAYLTPQLIPATTVAFCIEVPDAPEFLGLLRGLFLDLTDPAQWEQITGIEPKDAALLAEIILASFEGRKACEP